MAQPPKMAAPKEPKQSGDMKELRPPDYQSFEDLVVRQKNPYVRFAKDTDNKYSKYPNICIGQDEMGDLWDYTVEEVHDWYNPPGMSQETRMKKLDEAIAMVGFLSSQLLHSCLRFAGRRSFANILSIFIEGNR